MESLGNSRQTPHVASFDKAIPHGTAVLFGDVVPTFLCAARPHFDYDMSRVVEPAEQILHGSVMGILQPSYFRIGSETEAFGFECVIRSHDSPRPL